MSNTVLKTVTKQMILDCKAAVEASYMGRMEGFAEDFQAEPDRYGNLPRRKYRGAIAEFTVLGVDALMDLVIEKMAEGWKRSKVYTVSIGAAFTAYMIKPDVLIEEELKAEFKEAEQALRAQVDAENEQVIAHTVVQRKAQILKERERALKDADDALDAELAAEVRAALQSAK